jgi:hypothetical protein
MFDILFDGRELRGLGLIVPASCLVRNEQNGERKPAQVIYTSHTTAPGMPGVAYMPRPFPPGKWRVTDVLRMGDDTAFWPYFIATDAHQLLHVWDLDEKGNYLRESPTTFDGRAYGSHHARYFNGYAFVASRTTWGCINQLDPADSVELAHRILDKLKKRDEVFFLVPPWERWRA